MAHFCGSFAKILRSSAAEPDILEILQVDVRLVAEAAVGLLHTSIAVAGIVGHLGVMVRSVRLSGHVERANRKVDFDTPFLDAL